jgi:hypothetical protein
VNNELRQLAAETLTHEQPLQKQATVPDHDAYLGVAEVAKFQHWNRRDHFFAAGAKAMRCVLVVRQPKKPQTRWRTAACRSRRSGSSLPENEL